MGSTKTLLTAEQFDNLSFDEAKRYELDEGELIEMTRPAYLHNRVLIRLTARLFNFFESHPIGEALLSENLYALAPNTRLAPDLAVVLGDRRQGLAGSTVIPVVPDLVVEVISPNETPARIHRKLGQYFRAGVKEIWLIDPEDSSVEIWTGPALPERSLTGDDEIASALLSGFRLALTDLFG